MRVVRYVLPIYLALVEFNWHLRLICSPRRHVWRRCLYSMTKKMEKNKYGSITSSLETINIGNRIFRNITTSPEETRQIVRQPGINSSNHVTFKPSSPSPRAGSLNSSSISIQFDVDFVNSRVVLSRLKAPQNAKKKYPSTSLTQLP